MINSRRKIASLFTAAALAVSSSIALSTPAHAGTANDDYLTLDYIGGYYLGCINPLANDVSAGTLYDYGWSFDGAYVYPDGVTICAVVLEGVSHQPFDISYSTTTSDAATIHVSW